jgi:hypothetical protein
MAARPAVEAKSDKKPSREPEILSSIFASTVSILLQEHRTSIWLIARRTGAHEVLRAGKMLDIPPPFRENYLHIGENHIVDFFFQIERDMGRSFGFAGHFVLIPSDKLRRVFERFLSTRKNDQIIQHTFQRITRRY